MDPILKLNTPVYEYAPGAWGPKEAAEKITPPGGWKDPVIENPAVAATAVHINKLRVLGTS